MFVVVDYIENWWTGDVVGTCETRKDAEKLCKEWYEDTDGECDLEIIEESK